MGALGAAVVAIRPVATLGDEQLASLHQEGNGRRARLTTFSSEAGPPVHPDTSLSHRVTRATTVYLRSVHNHTAGGFEAHWSSEWTGEK